MPNLPHIRCVYCRRPGKRFVCRGCEPHRRPTALQRWLTTTGTRQCELAERAGCAARTVLRATQGAPIGGRQALALHRLTGIPFAVLVEGLSYEDRSADGGDAGKAGERGGGVADPGDGEVPTGGAGVDHGGSRVERSGVPSAGH